MDFLSKLSHGLSKTKRFLLQEIEAIFAKNKTQDSCFEDLEALLIGADTGALFASQMVAKLKKKLNHDVSVQSATFIEAFKGAMIEALQVCPLGAYELRPNELNAIMVIGMNGAGKTTTIGKLAYHFKNEGKKVMLVAADTFRAAAIEQLDIWGQRVGVDVVKPNNKADPASVVFNAVRTAKESATEVLLIDTAGRLHTNSNLMEELKKMQRIAIRELQGVPLEVLLVLDASSGQNALVQAKMFHEALGVTGIALTKLDGTAKGGIVMRIASELAIPIRYIGIGEGIEDLQPFDAEKFADALWG